MERRKLIQSARSHVHGADFMTTTEYAEWRGVSLSTAKRKLAELPKIERKYYCIPEIVDEMLRRS